MKTVCAKEYVDSKSTDEAQKWKNAYNTLRKRSVPAVFDDDELTVLMDTPITSGNITLSQPYTDFDGLLFEYTGTNNTILSRVYLSTEEINRRVELVHNASPNEPHAIFVIDGIYYWTIRVATQYDFSPTAFPYNDANLRIWRIYGVKFKEIT